MQHSDRNNTAVHLIGHAVAHYILTDTQPVKITIAPCNGALGFTQFDPPVDKIPSVEAMTNRIIVAVSGRAVQIVKDQNDTSEARNMEMAMRQAEQLADMQSPNWRTELPETARNIVQSCLDRAVELVRPNMDYIDRVASVLLEKGSLTGAELAAI